MSHDKKRWIQTFTGRKVDPIDVRPEDVDIIDIAHALSMICRFNGHTRRFYSVAEHCVEASAHVSRFIGECDRETMKLARLAALLHDAHEAYTGDIARPWKDDIWVTDRCDSMSGKWQPMREVEADNQASILQALAPGMMLGRVQHAVRDVDLALLRTEADQLVLWESMPPWPCVEAVKPLPIVLTCYHPMIAKQAFINTYGGLEIGATA